MSRLFYHVMQDNGGNLLFGVTGTMRLAGTGTAATIYGDEALTVILPNPMTNHPSFGSFKCYLAPGSYDFYMAKSGYTFETLTGIQGLGTMATQDASSVSVTGPLTVGGLLTVYADMRLNSHLGINTPPSSYGIDLRWTRTQGAGFLLQPADSNTNGPALLFANTAAGLVGSIFTDGTTTAYNTSSDARLKKDVEALTGALDVVRALRPVRFRWKSDDSPGQGLLAQEVEPLVPAAVSGTEDGELPMGIDYSKLVPYLIGAVKELTAQVEILTARCDAASA